MMSEARQRYWAQILIDQLWGSESIDFDEDREGDILREARRLVSDWMKELGDLDELVSKKIRSLKREIPEGSLEWKVMYDKYLKEEKRRRGWVD